MKIQEIHNLFLQCNGVVIDTRKIIKDVLFVALKGERFDANTFANEAVEKGAKYVIIDNKDFEIKGKTILVNDALACLQQLSKFHRNYLKLPILALTGSNGKTTTKELINVVLSKKYKTGATVGNLNNHIGVSLTLLSFDKTTEFGIVEMGANHQKEIEFLCEIVMPDYGYITNFGKAHLEGFGGIEGVIKGKSEMYDYLHKNQKTAFVNGDDEIQVSKTEKIEQFVFSTISEKSNLKISSVEANPLVSVEFENVKIKSNLIGLYNATNINAAIAIGNYFDISAKLMKDAIESYVPENNRSQLIEQGSNKILLDAYNANPSSMMAALENFIQLSDKNKILILGDMFELGDESNDEHKKLVDFLLDKKEMKFIFVGEFFYSNKNNLKNFTFFKTFDTFSSYMKDNKLDSSFILIKGSRGMALERILSIL